MFELIQEIKENSPELKDKTEELILFNDKLVAGSLSMTSVKIV